MKIEIDKDAFIELLCMRNKYLALEDGGVDNWCGYSDSLQEALKLDQEENYTQDELFKFCQERGIENPNELTLYEMAELEFEKYWA